MVRRDQIQQMAETLGGIPVWGTLPGTPAARAGVRFGDIIVAVNGRRTRTLDDYLAAKDANAAGLELTFFRDGVEMTVALTHGTQAPASPTEIVDALVDARVLPDVDELPPRPSVRPRH